MQVKRLEVVGFKSFLEKLTFDFTAPVTAVVGPNGCGKSNIVDAIKWVTGELSFKELRGRSMEDLIFSGSELRPPTGMAEVSLTLDNTTGKAPEQYREYDEITVTRRVFRDGTSEFFINKVACRLRDIVDIFLDTGIGRGSYSIIEQGRVGQIVASKPEDRRVIIEEAAGITKYKHRKKAAERKMEYTRQNLLRVSDVLGELKRQIGSLERAARKAERYRRFRDEAREIDLALSGKQFRTLTTLLGDLDTSEANLTENLSGQQTDLTVKEADLEKERLELVDEEKTLQQTQEALYQKASEIQNLENRTESLKREITRLDESADRDRKRSETLLEEAELTHQNLESLRRSTAELCKQKESLDADIQAAHEREIIARDEVATTENRLETSKQSYIEIVALEAELKNQISSLEKRYNDLKAEIGIRERELAAAEAERKELENEFKASQESVGLSIQLRFGFEREQTETRDRLHNLREEQSTVEERLRALGERVEGDKSRVAALEEFEKTYQGYQTGVRTVMEGRNDPKSPYRKVHGLLGEVIKAKKGYEKAVEAILADRIECLVVDYAQDALAAIKTLKSSHKGRGVFLPQTFLHENRRSDELTKPGIKGRLLDVVDVESSCREGIEALLQDVFIVESLDRAIELRHDKLEATMVTADGDLVTRQGIIIGGSWGEERGVLQVKREIEDLSEAISRGLTEKANAERRLEQIKKEIAAADAHLKRMDAKVQEATETTVGHEKEIERLQEGLRRCRQNEDTIRSERLRLVKDLEEIEANKENASNELQTKTTQRAKLEADVAEQTERLTQQRVELSQCTEAISALRVQIASLTERLEGHVREEQSLEQTETNARVQADELKAHAQKAVEESGRCTQEIKTLSQQREEAIRRHEERNDEYQKVKVAHEFRAANAREAEAALRELRDTVAELSEKLSQHRLRTQEERLRLDHLNEQIRERYDVDLTAWAQSEEFTTVDENEEEEKRATLETLREKMAKMGDVSLGAIEELEQLKERQEFLFKQKEDLENSIQSLQSAIKKINATTKQRFADTFEAVNARFTFIFPQLFRGGKARLQLTDPENILETGVDVIAQPPGKRLQNMNLLSGGEKALTAISLIFAIFQTKAPPFCLLDEVDAPLDDANVHRFLHVVKDMTDTTQFIIVTHNKATMESAENLYGITMEEPGVSRLVSVNISKQAVQAPAEKTDAEGALASLA